ncbi:MAG: hypothetical protein HY036_01110 [Nitrospirae bacterium]|nr:hypothetical protein [Nitrospirota bacterium]MBI3351156.1 hypothetical protein [Nitrospirota bacterium]
MVKNKLFPLIFVFIFGLFSCATPQQGGPDSGHGFSSMFLGIGHLVLSPLQIAAGLLEGVAAVPYYAATSLKDINDGLIKAQAKVTLNDTYESAYGKRLDQVGPDGNTGEAFRRMKNASEYYQKVLKQYGVKDAQHYILTSIDTANKDGFTLFAVVYRPYDSIEVIDKYDGKTIRKFSKDDRLFYEPYKQDINGQSLDTVIDWAGAPVDGYKTQKQQAVLMTLAANSVVEGKKRTDYWDVEKRWIAGEFKDIVQNQSKKVEQALGI